MSVETQSLPDAIRPDPIRKPALNNAFTRVARYTLVRVISLFVTVVIGIYLTILIANMGGIARQKIVLEADYPSAAINHHQEDSRRVRLAAQHSEIVAGLSICT